MSWNEPPDPKAKTPVQILLDNERMRDAERAADLAFQLLSPAEYICVMGRRRGQPPAAKRATDAELAKRLGIARQTLYSVRRDALLRLRFEATRNGIESP